MGFAGLSGYCKHCSALLYHLWGLQKKKVADVPRDKSITEVPAYWRQRSSEGSKSPLLFGDITVVKHGPLPTRSLTDAQAVELLNPERTRLVESYQPFLNAEDRLLCTSDLRGLAADLADCGTCPMVVDALESNDFRPEHDPVTLIAMDHTYSKSPASKLPLTAELRSFPAARVQLAPSRLSPAVNIVWDDFVASLEEGEASAYATLLPVQLCQNVIDHSTEVSEEQLSFLQRKGICVSEDGAARLCRATMKQATSPAWHHIRRLRLTASYFGSVIKRRCSVYPTSLLRQICYPSSRPTEVCSG